MANSIATFKIADQFPFRCLIWGFYSRLLFLELLDLRVHMLSRELRRNIQETEHVIVCYPSIGFLLTFLLSSVWWH